jgi:hypothetical protein
MLNLLKTIQVFRLKAIGFRGKTLGSKYFIKAARNFVLNIETNVQETDDS